MALGSSNPTTNLTKVKNTTVDVNKGIASDGTQRVVIASDNPTLPVTLIAGTSSIGKVDINQVYLEDAASADGASLFVAGAVRSDTLATTTSANGDYTWLKTNSVGRLYTSATLDASLPAGSAIVGKTYLTDGTRDATVKAASTAALAADTALVTAFHPSTPLPLGTNNIGFVGINAGSNTIGKVDINQVYAEDVASTGGEALHLAGAIRQDTPSLSTSADGDYSNLKVNSVGRLYTSTSLDAALPVGTNIIGKVNLIAGITEASIKAGSTLPAATDTAIVVTIRDPINTSSTGTLGKLAANDGVDIGDVTINNASLPVTQSGIWNIGAVSSVTNITQLSGQVIAMGSGVRSAGTQRVTIATDDIVPISDNNGSLTVDAPVTTPLHVRLSDGTSAISTLPVSLASVPSHPVTNAGIFTVQENGAALTSLQLLDDVVATNGSTALTKAYHIAGTDGVSARILSTNAVGHINIADGGNSITVDAPVGTPLFVRFSDGTNALATLPVSISSMPSTPVTNAGIFTIQENGAALTALQLIDDSISTVGNAVLTKGIQITGTDGTSSRVIATTNVGYVKIDDGNGSITIDGGVNINSLSSQMNSNATTTAYANSLIIKGLGQGNLFMLTGYNAHTSGQFIQLHNSTTVPADGLAPAITFFVAAQSNFSLDFGVYGRYFSTGIMVCNSTTGPTKTIGAANCWFDAQFK